MEKEVEVEERNERAVKPPGVEKEVEVEENMSVQLSLPEGRRKGRKMSCAAWLTSWSRTPEEVTLRKRKRRRL